MSESEPARSDLDASLQRVRRSVWVALAVCALVVVTQEATTPEPPPDRTFTTAAVALAFVGIVMRMLAASPVAGWRLRLGAVLCGLVAILGIGIVGVVVAIQQGALQTGLLFCGGAFLFSLRPPPTIVRSASPDA